MIDRRQLLFAGMLATGSAAAAMLRPRRVPLVANQLEAAVPTTVGPYRYATAAGVVLPPRDELGEQLYDQYLARSYVAPGRPPVMLLIAYGSTQDYQLQLHRPEICYPAVGYMVGEARRVPIMLGGARPVEATALTATRDAQREQILYWTRIGEAFPTTTWGERAAIVRGALRREIPDGVLVRLSVVTVDAGAATAALIQFNAQLIASLQPPARRLLLGTGA